jgi:hypothetical protein
MGLQALLAVGLSPINGVWRQHAALGFLLANAALLSAFPAGARPALLMAV